MNRALFVATAVAFACLPLVTTSPTFAQMSTDTNGDTRGKQPTAADNKMAGERFVKMAYSGNMLHVKASEYALSQVNDPTVRELAEKLIKDHTMANERLATLAKAKGIELPTDLPPPQKTMLESAMMVKGEMFAVTYLINMTTLHVRDVLECSHVAADGDDAETKAFAKEALPVLKPHLKMVRPMAEAACKVEGPM